MDPSVMPSASPSSSPSLFPSLQHSDTPSSSPSASPSAPPSTEPTSSPSARPSAYPTVQHSSPPSLSPVSTPSESPSGSPTMSPTIPDIISDSTGCKDVEIAVTCEAERNDGTVVDCKALRLITNRTVDDEYLQIKWTYRATNNCPYPRTFARQHIKACTLCIPPGLQCTKEAYAFRPESSAERHFTLPPNGSATSVEEQTIVLDKPSPCMYSRDVVVRIRGNRLTSVGSFATDVKYTFVSPSVRPKGDETNNFVGAGIGGDTAMSSRGQEVYNNAAADDNDT